MKNLLEPFSKILRQYCKDNNLSYEKIIESPKCGNDNLLVIQHCKPNSDGLKDNEPAEIIIMLRRHLDGSVRISPGENIKKHLAIRKENE